VNATYQILLYANDLFYILTVEPPLKINLEDKPFIHEIKKSLQWELCVGKKNQLDATEWFIALVICSTCFGQFYAHHQELETMCVITAYGNNTHIVSSS